MKSNVTNMMLIAIAGCIGLYALVKYQKQMD